MDGWLVFVGEEGDIKIFFCFGWALPALGAVVHGANHDTAIDPTLLLSESVAVHSWSLVNVLCDHSLLVVTAIWPRLRFAVGSTQIGDIYVPKDCIISKFKNGDPDELSKKLQQILAVGGCNLRVLVCFFSHPTWFCWSSSSVVFVPTDTRTSQHPDIPEHRRSKPQQGNQYTHTYAHGCYVNACCKYLLASPSLGLAQLA